MVGFALSFDMTSWVEQLGFLTNFAIYGGIMGDFALGGPIMYIYGKRIRAWTAGRLESPYNQMQVDAEKARGEDGEKNVAIDIPAAAVSAAS